MFVFGIVLTLEIDSQPSMPGGGDPAPHIKIAGKTHTALCLERHQHDFQQPHLNSIQVPLVFARKNTRPDIDWSMTIHRLTTIIIRCQCLNIVGSRSRGHVVPNRQKINSVHMSTNCRLLHSLQVSATRVSERQLPHFTIAPKYDQRPSNPKVSTTAPAHNIGWDPTDLPGLPIEDPFEILVKSVRGYRPGP